MVGTALNELLLIFIPEHWALYEVMSATIKPTWSIEQLNLVVLDINFGIAFNFKILTLLGIITGCLFGIRSTLLHS